MEERVILAIDLKSFYASVECKRRGMDPFETPLVVADLFRGNGTIVLAASPYIKSRYGVKSRCRLSEVDRRIPGLVIARPHMQDYLEESAAVNAVYLDYVDESDLHVYSIDESFLDVTHYLKRAGDTPESYARKILRDLLEKRGLVATCGIGSNLFLAKCAMDLEAKKRRERLAYWRKEDLPEKLWNVRPLSRIWGIGSHLERRLLALGFATMGDIAAGDRNYLCRHLGVIGEEIYCHALGEDDARIQDRYESRESTVSVGEVLLRDYKGAEVPTLVHDLVLELSEELQRRRVLPKRIDLVLGAKDGTAVRRVLDLEERTSSSFRLWTFLKPLVLVPAEGDYRRIHLVASDLSGEESFQGTLFRDEEGERRERACDEALQTIRRRYGTSKAMPCSALLSSSTYWIRHQQIGGHHR